MGNLAVASAQASTLAANGRAVADLAGGKFGFLTSGGNTVGGYLAGAVPGKGGKTAAAIRCWMPTTASKPSPRCVARSLPSP
ncbi:hypothetical protein G6F57_022180 [Rhizopus arrhizus]|nr:hypothetical protein G6F57_022180 [Rhizopus arrhizus]